MSRLQRTGEIRMHDTSVSAWEETVDEAAMRLVLRAVLGRLRRRGFNVAQDPDTLAHYPSIARDYWIAQKQDLRAYINLCGRHLQVVFYQEINTENPHGGRHDFGKFRRMPSTVRLQCIVEVAQLLDKLYSLGYRHVPWLMPERPSLLQIRDAMAPPNRTGTLEGFNRSWNFDSDWKRGIHRFARDEFGWPTAAEIGKHYDADGVLLRNGDVRYVRHYGRIKRGVIRTNMNGMWSIGDFAYVSSGELFSVDPTQMPRRYVPEQTWRLEKELKLAMERREFSRVSTLGRLLGERESLAAQGIAAE